MYTVPVGLTDPCIIMTSLGVRGGAGWSGSWSDGPFLPGLHQPLHLSPHHALRPPAGQFEKLANKNSKSGQLINRYIFWASIYITWNFLVFQIPSFLRFFFLARALVCVFV